MTSHASGLCIAIYTLIATLIPAQAQTLRQALDSTNLDWATGGDAAWLIQTTNTHDGVSAAQSGFIIDGGSTWLTTEATGPTILSFWWSVSSESGFDYLSFSIDGEQQSRISGSGDWQQEAYDLPAGIHTLTWIYSKDRSVSVGGDAGWLDEVSFGAAEPPAIIVQPTNQVVGVCGSVTFTVRSTGRPPPTYHWRLNGDEIMGARSNSLVLNNVQQAQSGSYDVVLNSLAGSATSSPAILTVITPPLGEAVNTTNLDWTTGGDAAWLIQTTNTHDGVSAAQSGFITDYGTTWLTTEVTGPTILSFWWSVSSESGFDYLSFSIDGEERSSISGWGDWRQETYDLPTGIHTLTWVYSGDGDVGAGADAAWLDEVSLGAAEPPAIIVQPTNQVVELGGSVTFVVQATGNPPPSYQWRFNGIDIPGAGDSRLELAGLQPPQSGLYEVVLANVAGAITSAPALLTVAVPLPVITSAPSSQSVWIGSSVRFSILATGIPPLAFQWRRDGMLLANATSNRLTLPQVQPQDAGLYDVAVTTWGNSVTSAPARLTVLTGPDDLGRPRVQLGQQSTNLQFHFSFQNTQGVFFLLAAETPERLKGSAETLMMDTLTPTRDVDLFLPCAQSGRNRFFSLAEYPTATTNDYQQPGPSGEVTNTSPLGFLGTQGVPATLIAGQPFQATFILFATNGLPLPVDGEARVVLLAANGAPVPFAYTLAPSTLWFSNGVAEAVFTLQTTGDVVGVTLALEAVQESRAEKAAFSTQTARMLGTTSVTGGKLKLTQIIGPWETKPSSTVPGALALDPKSPTYLTDLATKYQEYRQTSGTASPAWGYPSAGQRRAQGTFGEWYRAGGRIHDGIDLNGPAETDVLAAEQGIVTAIVPAGDDSYIVIDHGFGTWTLYQHVYVSDTQCQVKMLDAVTNGMEITKTYPTTKYRPHLHFGIHVGEPGDTIQYQSQPGTPINPVTALSSFLYPEHQVAQKMAPTVSHVGIAPASCSPRGWRYPKENRILDSDLATGKSGHAYVVVQTVDIHSGNHMAPYQVTFSPEPIQEGPRSAILLTFDSMNAVDRYAPNVEDNDDACGIALYSVENPIPVDEKYRYWFNWDTSGYRVHAVGPRKFTVQANDGLGRSSPAIEYVFGPEVLDEKVEAITQNTFRFTLVSHLGYEGDEEDALGFIQPDKYKLELIPASGAPIALVPDSGPMTSGYTKLFTENLGRAVYTFTRPNTVDAKDLKLRVSSLLAPDIGHEVPLSPLFSDDFNNNAIDPNKWTSWGNSVVESGQFMSVLQSVTDAGGHLTSIPFPINRTGNITLTRRSFLHHQESYSFNGRTHFFWGKLLLQIGALPTIGIHYDDLDYDVPPMSANSVAKHGFFISRNGVEAPYLMAVQGDVSPVITPVWDTWFEEKITYDPGSGLLEYYINNTKQMSYSVGALPSGASPTMTLSMDAWGWWTGHQQLFDDLVVTQATVAPH